MAEKFHHELVEILSQIAETDILRARFKKVSTPRCNNEVVVFEKNVAYILLSSPDIRCILKMHYNYNTGENILRAISENKTFSKIQVDDLFKEACNLLAGRTKKILIESGINIGISIPLRARGFDEFFFDRKDSDPLSLELSWDV